MFDFSVFPELTTDRLILRALTHADAEAMRVLFSDPQVLEFLNNEPTDTLEQAIGLIDWLNGQYDRHNGVNWAIRRRADDRFIGQGGCYAWDREDRKVDIGYHVLPEFWGSGYATEATRAILHWCFDALEVHRVQADCTEGNIGSERVMLKCGFRHEGTWRESCWEHGRFVNIKQFGLLRHELI